MKLQARSQGVGKARLTFFSVERFGWVSGLRAFGVLWVFGVLQVFHLLTLVRCFPLYNVGVPRGALRFYKSFPLLTKKIEIPNQYLLSNQ